MRTVIRANVSAANHVTMPNSGLRRRVTTHQVTKATMTPSASINAIMMHAKEMVVVLRENVTSIAGVAVACSDTFCAVTVHWVNPSGT